MADTNVRLVLLETSGNQRFIFDTNKIREVIGASEMVYQAGTRLVLEAVAEKRTIGLSDEDWNTPDGLRRFLLDPTKNPPIEEQGDPSTAVEIIVATSGKALLLVQCPEVGKEIIEHVTRAALSKLPGLTLRGVVGKAFPVASDAKAFDEQIKAVHKALAALGADVPGAETRFPRLPVVAPCETSGLPAAQVRIWTGKDGTPRSDERPTRLSVVSAVKGGYFAKRNQVPPEGLPEQGWDRIVNSVPEMCRGYLAKTVETLEIRISGRSELKDRDDEGGGERRDPRDGLTWLSVIHADGNGLGQIFLNFGTILETALDGSKPTSRTYVDHLCRFSLALDVCTANAFAEAIVRIARDCPSRLRPDGSDSTTADDLRGLAVVPVILGGDDLTVLCDGRIAVSFAKAFLDEFEKQTGCKDLRPLPGKTDETAADHTAQPCFEDVVPKIAEQTSALGVPRLSACAGVAIVKGHFPFHQAYHLAEALLKSAKATKTWTDPAGQLSALDYHVLYDASGADLARIRERLTLPDESRLFARPYVVTPLNDSALAAFDAGVISKRHWASLEAAMDVLGGAANKGADGDRDKDSGLSRTLQHDLRAALFLGAEAAKARLGLIKGRVPKTSYEALLMNGEATGPLPEFHKGKQTPETVNATRLLDAMDIVEFWQGA